MIAKLIPIDGSEPILIARDLTIVGRKRGLCDIVVNHASISKLHCAIAKTDGLLFIRDLGSTNGTKVNGQKVARGALLPGDELAFASTRFRVHLGPGSVPVNPTDRTEELKAFPRLVEEEEFVPEPELVASGDSEAGLQNSSSEYEL